MSLNGKEFRVFTRRGSVRAWVPLSYNGAWTVLYAHGYGVDVENSWEKHSLPSQFESSGVPAFFACVQSPMNNDQNVFFPDLKETLHLISEKVGFAVPRRVAAIFHGSGYRTVCRWLDDEYLKQVISLDGLYGYLPELAKFASRGGIMSVYTDKTAENTEKLAKNVHIQYIKVSDTDLVGSGRYIGPLLKRSSTWGSSDLARC